MISINIKDAQTKLSELVSSCIKQNKTINIKTNEGNVIIMSESNYNDIIESLHLLSTRGMYRSVEEGINEKLEDCIKKILLYERK